MMKTNLSSFLIVLALAATVGVARAGWLDALGLGKTSTNSAASPALAALSQDQMVGGLKDALGNGLQHAIAQLGHDGGFLTNLNVKIPLPEKLQSVEKALRAVKQDKYADEFVATMNHAAEQAVPEAASVFGDAVKQMSIDDAKSVLTGPPDAATQFFRRTTQTNLYARFSADCPKGHGEDRRDGVLQKHDGQGQRRRRVRGILGRAGQQLSRFRCAGRGRLRHQQDAGRPVQNGGRRGEADP